MILVQMTINFKSGIVLTLSLFLISLIALGYVLMGLARFNSSFIK